MGAWPEQRDFGPFKVGFLPISHSIPESGALVIDTSGRPCHRAQQATSSWTRRLMVGEAFDPELVGRRLQRRC